MRRLCVVARGSPAGMTDLRRLAAPLLVLARSQIRLQIDFLSTAAPDGDLRALTLAAAALAAGGGVLACLYHLLTLELFGLVLALALVAAAALALLLEAEGATAAQLAARPLARLPALRTAAGRAARSSEPRGFTSQALGVAAAAAP